MANAERHNCPICDGTSSNFSTKEGRNLLICASCRHIFWKQMPSPSQLSEFYANEYTSTHDQENIQEALLTYYRSHALELKQYCEQFPLLSIADIGCSIPVFLREAAAIFAIRFGVDYAQEAHILGKKWGISMLTPDAFDAAVADQSLDVIRYSHALEHMIDPKSQLKLFIRKLKIGGIIYVTQPNFPIMKLQNFCGELLDSVWPKHLHFFNPLSIKTVCTDLNLKLQRFCTHSNDDGAFEKYYPNLDIKYAAENIEDLSFIEDNNRGAFSRWPFYCGENMECFARKL